jgi:HlyD family secretion protein
MGTSEGKVIDIDQNITVNQQTGEAYFKVRCVMDKNYLQLKMATKDKLEKNDTYCRFYLLDRTLWQLLFDRVDDWFNPNLSKKVRHTGRDVLRGELLFFEKT